MKRNDIRIRKETYSGGRVNRFKDFDKVSREYRRQQEKNKAQRIAFIIITALAVIMTIIYAIKF